MMRTDKKKQVSVLFSLLNRKRQELDVFPSQLARLGVIGDIKTPVLTWKYTALSWRIFKNTCKVLCLSWVVFLACFTFVYLFHWPVSRSTMFHYLKPVAPYSEDDNCFLKMDGITSNTIRTPLHCDFCRNVTTIDRVSNMTKELFLEKYAYTGRPVLIIKGHQKLTTDDGKPYDFDFIKSLYPPDSPTLNQEHRLCEYQPKYGLEDARTVEEMLNMTYEKIHSRGGPGDQGKWYAGWTNCDRKVKEKYVELFLPNFLPRLSEPDSIAWTFMGSPGLGFTLHIDASFKPQWHTQLHGRKRWTLEPPSECYFECPHEPMAVVMDPGDIIVFHNGMWYHQTENVGEDISIGVAMEYD